MFLLLPGSGQVLFVLKFKCRLCLEAFSDSPKLGSMYFLWGPRKEGLPSIRTLFQVLLNCLFTCRSLLPIHTDTPDCGFFFLLQGIGFSDPLTKHRVWQMEGSRSGWIQANPVAPDIFHYETSPIEQGTHLQPIEIVFLCVSVESICDKTARL